jgi:hypothetical protein
LTNSISQPDRKACLIAILREAIDWAANRLAEQVGSRRPFSGEPLQVESLKRDGTSEKGRVVREQRRSRSRLIVLALLELEELHRVGAVQVIPFTEIDRLEQASVDIRIQIAHLDERACCRNVEVCWNGNVADLDKTVAWVLVHAQSHAALAFIGGKHFGRCSRGKLEFQMIAAQRGPAGNIFGAHVLEHDPFGVRGLQTFKELALRRRIPTVRDQSQSFAIGTAFQSMSNYRRVLYRHSVSPRNSLVKLYFNVVKGCEANDAIDFEIG